MGLGQSCYLNWVVVGGGRGFCLLILSGGRVRGMCVGVTVRCALLRVAVRCVHGSVVMRWGRAFGCSWGSAVGAVGGGGPLTCGGVCALGWLCLGGSKGGLGSGVGVVSGRDSVHVRGVECVSDVVCGLGVCGGLWAWGCGCPLWSRVSRANNSSSIVGGCCCIRP